MRILFVSPRQCWPARSGAKLREYHFLRALATRGEVTYLHFTEPGGVPLTRADLPFCRDVVAVPKPDAYGMLKMAQGICGRWPLPVLNYTSAEMSRAADRLISDAGFDLIHLDSIHMIRYAGSSERVVYNWHNIESEAMLRYSATVPSKARRWYARHTAAKLEALERRMLRTALGHVVCSERERMQLQKLAPGARIAVVENGVDTNSFAAAGDSSAPGRQIVFVGTMDYYPNVDAATSFVRNIWPQIHGTISDARLVIVGANPTPEVQALGQIAGVTVTGTVPDVRPYYRDALAAIVPLRTGGGTRLKILESMAAGVPVVSTPLGAEGLAVTAGRDILLVDADDRAGWIGHLNDLSTPNGQRTRITEAALQLVRTRYDWEILGQLLSATYSDWLRGQA